MTLYEMLNRISSKELTEWYAYEMDHPFHSDIDRNGHAVTSQIIANRLRTKNEKAYSLDDFIPKRKKPQSSEQQISIAQMITMGMGGQDLREDANG